MLREQKLNVDVNGKRTELDFLFSLRYPTIIHYLSTSAQKNEWSNRDKDVRESENEEVLKGFFVTLYVVLFFPWNDQ